VFELGIVGGMGPEATAEIHRRIVAYTAARSDQEHIPMCILNEPRIASRTDYVLHGAESPLKTITRCIDALAALGVRNFIIPCNTSHVFAESFSRREDISFVDMVEETKRHVRYSHGNRRRCVLATAATVALDLYGDATAGEPPSTFYPDRRSQAELGRIISSVKGKREPLRESRRRLVRVMERIRERERECVFILACTELSVAMAGSAVRGIRYVDAMDVLAVAAIARCGYDIDGRAPKSARRRHRPQPAGTSAGGAAVCAPAASGDKRQRGGLSR
jgi:aspartate racemase